MRLTEAEYTTILRRNPGVRVAEPPRRPHSNAPTEAEEQEAVVVWAQANRHIWPDLAFLFHIPNGGQRNIRTAMLLKTQGVQPGVPDLFLPVPRGEWHGLWIELKRADHSNSPTNEQKRWLDYLRNAGYMVAVCYGAYEAVRTIESYMGAT